MANKPVKPTWRKIYRSNGTTEIYCPPGDEVRMISIDPPRCDGVHTILECKDWMLEFFSSPQPGPFNNDQLT